MINDKMQMNNDHQFFMMMKNKNPDQPAY